MLPPSVVARDCSTCLPGAGFSANAGKVRASNSERLTRGWIRMGGPYDEFGSNGNAEVRKRIVPAFLALTRRLIKHDHAFRIAAGKHVTDGVAELGERVGAGHQFVELQFTGAIVLEDAR